MRDGTAVDLKAERTSVDTRRARMDRLLAAVDETFPGEERRGLRENIARSFGVPQVGEYHNEGAFMDSHLDLIVKNVEAVARGEFPSEVDSATREALIRAVRHDPISVRKYVFLHDIAKADCLTIKFGDEDRAVTWDGWQEMLAGSESGRRAALGDERALRDFCAEQGITGVSYFQNVDGSGKRQHGKVGAEELRALGEPDETMLAAIEAHEAAYQFQGISVSAYERHFGEMSPEARDFAMLASYADTMSSLRPDRRPDLSNFLALAGSREKSEALAALAARLSGADLDSRKFDRAWAALRHSSEPLSADTVGATEAKLRAECGRSGYDVDRLRAGIESLVTKGALTADEGGRLFAMALDDPRAIGRAFPSKMKDIAFVLKGART